MTSWTPVRKLKILVVTRASLSAAIDWIRREYGEKVVDHRVAKKIATKELLMQSHKVVNTNELFKKLVKTKKLAVYEIAKHMKPYEFFGAGERFDKNKARELRRGTKIDPTLPGGLRATQFHCSHVNAKMRNRAKKENVSCAPISLTNTGFFRYSTKSFDVGMYHYLFKFLKHMKYDGVKLVTKGFHDNAGAKVEYVIGNKMLKKVA